MTLGKCSLILLFLAGCASPVQPVIEEQTAEPNQVPTARIVGPVEVTVGGEALYTAETYDGDGDPLSIEWTVDGERRTGREMVLLPQSEGAVEITLEVSDGVDSATERAEVDVVPSPWMPETLTVYIMDATAERYDEDSIIETHYCETAEDYDYLMGVMPGYIDMHNRDYPDTPWDYIGGGV